MPNVQDDVNVTWDTIYTEYSQYCRGGRRQNKGQQ